MKTQCRADVGCIVWLGRSSTHLTLTAIAIVGPGICMCVMRSSCPFGRKYHTPGVIRPNSGSCFMRVGVQACRDQARSVEFVHDILGSMLRLRSIVHHGTRAALEAIL